MIWREISPLNLIMNSSERRHQFDRRGARPRAHNRVDDACRVAAVLRAVGGIDLVVERWVGLHISNVFAHAASLDATFVAHLGAAEPGGGAPVNRPDVEVVAEADDPNRHRFAQRAVAAE